MQPVGSSGYVTTALSALGSLTLRGVNYSQSAAPADTEWALNNLNTSGALVGTYTLGTCLRHLVADAHLIQFTSPSFTNASYEDARTMVDRCLKSLPHRVTFIPVVIPPRIPLLDTQHLVWFCADKGTNTIEYYDPLGWDPAHSRRLGHIFTVLQTLLPGASAKRSAAVQQFNAYDCGRLGLAYVRLRSGGMPLEEIVKLWPGELLIALGPLKEQLARGGT